MKNYTILNIGAGTQSSAIYGMMADGEIENADYALFADTKDEPDWVYDQLEILRGLPGPEIVEVTAGDLMEDYRNGVPLKTKEGDRFASIPAYTAFVRGQKSGKVPRQCTREYKIEPIHKWIRSTLLGLNPKQHWPKGVHVRHLFGFSIEESHRAVSMQNSFGGNTHKSCLFPLLDDELRMTKHQCKDYIEDRTGHSPWRSSRCKKCPLQQPHHWRELRDVEPHNFEEAVEYDADMRKPGFAGAKGLREELYLLRGAIPLGDSKLEDDQKTMFGDDGCAEGCFL